MESALKGIGFNLMEKDEKGEKEGGEGLMIDKKALYHSKVVKYIIAPRIRFAQYLLFSAPRISHILLVCNICN